MYSTQILLRHQQTHKYKHTHPFPQSHIHTRLCTRLGMALVLPVVTHNTVFSQTLPSHHDHCPSWRETRGGKANRLRRGREWTRNTLSISLSLTHTHTHIYTWIYTEMHTHTHTHPVSLSLSLTNRHTLNHTFTENSQARTQPHTHTLLPYLTPLTIRQPHNTQTH